MRFRPCIDIHNGKVKQIVGSSLRDLGDEAVENFVAEHDAAWHARLFKEANLSGGHVILLNHKNSPYFEESKRQALAALAAFPGGLEIGGGITSDNAADWLAAGASRVIVQSYVFHDGKISFENLRRLEREIGKEQIVLDLSAAKKEENGQYYIMTDRWQKFTDTPLDAALMEALFEFCGEFLVHAISHEGLGGGIDEELVSLLADNILNPVTYAGGIRSMEDLEELYAIGDGRIDFTIGTGLDIYGGNLSFRDVVAFAEEH
ncbi:MAG: phosphoribosylformimino-5-aminoimidazole carboxamide ribotide isomerase [Lachnospiraceae bacterium]|nr:phosphoribosylformimino-5-aminoimidazole carboxamide ribotide isomerase [Lachnospiraceae bacterium]